LQRQGATGRVVYGVNELAMGIGVVDMIHRDGLKLMVKNGTVEKSNAAITLLRGLCRLMIADTGAADAADDDGARPVSNVTNINYQTRPYDSETRVADFSNGDPPRILGVVQKACQGTDIPSLSALLPWDWTHDKTPKQIEEMVYSRPNQQFMGRACRKYDGPPQKEEYKYIVPGIQVEDDAGFVSAASSDEARVMLIEHLKTLSGAQFGVYCTFSAFNKDTMGDTGVTFHLVTRKPSTSRKDPSRTQAHQAGTPVDDRRVFDISSEEIEEIRRHIYVREHPSCRDRGLQLYRQALRAALAQEEDGEPGEDALTDP